MGHDPGTPRTKYTDPAASPTRHALTHSTHSFELTAPGLVARAVENLFFAAGETASYHDRLPVLGLVAGTATGGLLGYMPGGLLYNVIGAALGLFFGAVAGTALGFLARNLLTRVLNRPLYALVLVRRGEYVRADGIYATLAESSPKGLLAAARQYCGGERHMLPSPMRASLFTACRGIIAEADDRATDAAAFYCEALNTWSQNLFVLISLLELVDMYHLHNTTHAGVNIRDAARRAAEKFLGSSKDRSLEAHLRRLIDVLFPLREYSATPPDTGRVQEAGVTSGPPAGPAYGSASGPFRTTCRVCLTEKPGSPVTTGVLDLTRGDSDESVSLDLPGMQFHLLKTLAVAMSLDTTTDVPVQKGWVSIQDLLDRLPWTTSSATDSSVHKLVYKVRRLLTDNGFDRNLIEENANGFYRLSTDPAHITLKHAPPSGRPNKLRSVSAGAPHGAGDS